MLIVVLNNKSKLFSAMFVFGDEVANVADAESRKRVKADIRISSHISTGSEVEEINSTIFPLQTKLDHCKRCDKNIYLCKSKHP